MSTTAIPTLDLVAGAEEQAIRAAVSGICARYGPRYARDCYERGEPITELWRDLSQAGYVGAGIDEAWGGGGMGMRGLSIVVEECAAAGIQTIMLVLSCSMAGTILERHGTDAQRERWLRGIGDGSLKLAFAITEPDAGSNSHDITTTARRDGDDRDGGWVLTGRKVYISGVDEASAILVVARTEDARTGRLKPCLFVVPTEAPGVEYHPIEMEIVSPERQFSVFLDQVRLPADALVGDENAGLEQLFAGLNPERIMAASFATGIGRFALDRATAYVGQREVFGTPIGAHQGLAHPLAQSKIEIELARLMIQKAAALYDAGDDAAAGEAANMAKYAAAEAACAAADRAVQAHGGNGITTEYGMAGLLVAARATRIAPVSREMILNFVGTHSLGLPKSY
jgi:alkylation response protein AidB-like acyl-CoA dehydrogenase